MRLEQVWDAIESVVSRAEFALLLVGYFALAGANIGMSILVPVLGRDEAAPARLVRRPRTDRPVADHRPARAHHCGPDGVTHMLDPAAPTVALRMLSGFALPVVPVIAAAQWWVWRTFGRPSRTESFF